MGSSGAVTNQRNGDDPHPETLGALNSTEHRHRREVERLGPNASSGEAEVRQAKADGRWNTAYAGKRAWRFQRIWRTP